MHLSVDHIAVIRACNSLLNKNNIRPTAEEFEIEFDCTVTKLLDNTYVVFSDEGKYNWFLLKWGE